MCLGLGLFVLRPHNSTPLMLAVQAGNLVVVDLLLNFEDVDLECKDSDGQTALQLAKMHGFPEIAELLQSL